MVFCGAAGVYCSLERCVLFPKSSLRPAIEEIGNEKKGKSTRRRNGLNFARLIYPV